MPSLFARLRALFARPTESPRAAPSPEPVISHETTISHPDDLPPVRGRGIRARLRVRFWHRRHREMLVARTMYRSGGDARVQMRRAIRLDRARRAMEVVS